MAESAKDIIKMLRLCAKVTKCTDCAIVCGEEECLFTAAAKMLESFVAEQEQMKKRVIIDLDPLYAGVISFTLVGSSAFECRVTSNTADLSKGMHFVIDENGKVQQRKKEDEK